MVTLVWAVIEHRRLLLNPLSVEEREEREEQEQLLSRTD